MNEVIVTASDTRYMPYLKGLVLSIRDLDLIIGKKRLAVIDSGLEREDIEWLGSHTCEVVERREWSCGWLFDPPLGSHNVAFVERPWLNDYFPDTDVIVWMDSDTWVQRPDALLAFLRVAGNGHVGCMPETSRNWAWNDFHRKVTLGWSLANYEKFFGADSAYSLFTYPMINNGVFSAPTKCAKFWRGWQSAFIAALAKNGGRPEFGIDQISFNWSLYNHTWPLYPMPDLYNWPCTHAMPVFKGGYLCEPLLPHAPLGIVHMMDTTKTGRHGIKTLDQDGCEIGGDARPLDYREYRVSVRSNNERIYSDWIRDDLARAD